MKKALICAILFSALNGLAAKAQENGETYAFKAPLTTVNEYDLATSQVVPIAAGSKVLFAKRGVKFVVQGITPTHVIIKIYNQSKALTSPANTHFLDQTDVNKFHAITIANFKENCSKFEIDVTVNIDALVMPIKLRFGNDQGGDFEFTQNVSLGGAIAIPITSKKNSSTFSENKLTIILGLMGNSVTVDDKTAPGVYTTKASVLALSPVAGFNIKRKKVAFGLITGLDVLTGKARKSWVYRKSPWLGLSIGTSLF